MAALAPNLHLAPHLRELCSILAAGIVRLRCRTAEELARDAARPGLTERVRYTSPPTRAVMPTHHVGDTHDHPQRSAGHGHLPSIPPADVLGRVASLKTTPTAELKQQWRELFGKEPPPFNRPYLESRLAYRIQELAYGGLKPETRTRLEALGEQLDGGNVVLRRIRADSRPLAGTRLLREWKGVEHAVTVLADGFEWEGRPYQSLSAIARAITGTRWNGWTFFGLKSVRRRAVSRRSLPGMRGHRAVAGAEAALCRLHPQEHGGRARPGVQHAGRPTRRL